LPYSFNPDNGKLPSVYLQGEIATVCDQLIQELTAAVIPGIFSFS
jgi:hypothetical protein